MVKTSRSEREEFCTWMGQEFPGNRGLYRLLETLMRLARRHGNLAVEDCNRGLSEKEKRGEERLEQRISAVAAEIGCTGVKLGGDPRGCTVKLILPSGRTNDFGGEGFCVPQ